MSFGDRLKAIRTRTRHPDGSKITQEDVAQALHVGRSTVGMWETGGHVPSPEIAKKLAAYFGVTLDYLFGEEQSGRETSSNGEVDEELYKRIEGAWRPVLTVKVPIIGVVRAGEPIFATPNIEGYLDVPATDIADAQHFYLRVRGDSMEPTIRENSLVLIRVQPEVEHGEMALVLIGGEEATIKRVFVANDHLILRADNPNYPPLFVEAGEARVVGKVVEMRVQF